MVCVSHGSVIDILLDFGRCGKRFKEPVGNVNKGVFKKKKIQESQDVLESNFLDVLLERMNLTFQEVLGEGGFGKVSRYTDEKGFSRIFKKINYLMDTEEIVFDEKKELLRGDGLATIDHANVLKVYGFVIYDSGKFCYKENIKNCEGSSIAGVFNEFVPDSQDLNSYISREEGKQNLCNPQNIKKLGLQIAEGILAIHKENYSHRDIKPENILINTKTGEVKIIDFGLMRNLNTTKTRKRSNSLVGTYDFMAPEFLGDIEKDGTGKKADVWSFGLVLFYISFGRLPKFISAPSLMIFNDLTNSIKNFAIGGKTIEELEKRSLDIKQKEIVKDGDFWDLLNHLICREEDRLTMKKAVEHPFFYGK